MTSVRMAGETPRSDLSKHQFTSSAASCLERGRQRIRSRGFLRPVTGAHQIVISPHGLLRAAFANNASATKKTIEGRQMTIISFTDRGKHKVVAYANDQNAIEWVESSYGHPVVGDIKVVTHYGPYRDFAGVKFPTKIIQYQDGKPTLDLTVTAVRANPPVDIQVPAHVRDDPMPVKSEKAADGVWYITGVSHYSVLIEMKDYLDRRRSAPLGDRRSNWRSWQK